MRLILIRHGIAEELESSSKKDDALRALTAIGRRKMKGAAKGLRALYPTIDVLATSPLKRAVQTAKIIYAAYGDKPQFVELDLLSGGQSPQMIVTWLKHNDLDAATIALVGHEPDLSRWAGWFVTGHEKGIVAMKKGSACAIDFSRMVGAGKGMIGGMYGSRALRKLG